MSLASQIRRNVRPHFFGLAARSAAGARTLASLVVLAVSAPAQQFERVSVDSTGTEGNAASVASVLSADGRTAAFSSYASNLVAGDTNGVREVFVRDATTHATVRVSLSSTGLEADGSSYSPSLSGDGRFVAFTSVATNLVPGDTNGVADVFVHDRDPDGNGILDEGNGVTSRVSVDSLGLEAHGPSYGAYSHTISADGRLVVFRSDAADLVAGDGNGKSDIFVRDQVTGMTRRVSVDSSGAEANNGSSLATISGNGVVVAFHSDASNLVPGDTNGVTDVFTHDLLSGVTTRASVDSSGLQLNRACSAPALSADGVVVAFRIREASTSVAVYGLCVHDSATGSTQQFFGGSYSYMPGWWAGTWYSQWTTVVGFPALSADGSRVAFVTSEGSAGVNCDLCPFFAGATGAAWVIDRALQSTVAVAAHSASSFSSESQALAWAPFYAPSLSDDGWKLAFESDSPSLVAGDTNGARDAFVCDVLHGSSLGTSYCTAQPNSTGQRAILSALGHEAASAHTLSLRAMNLPPNARGLFFYGSATTSVPFGDGRLCVSGIVQRLPSLTASSEGILTQADVFSVPMPNLPIAAGATYHFQGVYRDPAAMQSGFNLTHGLTISFVP